MTDRKLLCEGKYLRTIYEDNWEYVERVNGRHVVYIVPLNKNKFGRPELIFIEEYRIPLKKIVVGFPAGLVGDVGAEEIITAAYRELEEETGYSAGKMQHLVSGPSSAGLSNETIHIYLANELVKVSDGGGIDGEDIKTESISIYDSEEWLQNKSKNDKYAIDIKSYIGVYYANKMIKNI